MSLRSEAYHGGLIIDLVIRWRPLKVPPPELRARVGNSRRLSEYIQIGSRTASCIRHLLASEGYDLSSFARLLDFACGCGRTISFIREYVESGRLYGCDSNETLISWCRSHLQIADCVVNEKDPPTPFPDSHFDLIYAISFFTHLDAVSQKAWLEEWKRLVKDDGLVLISVLGPGLAQRESVAIPETGMLCQVLGNEFNQQLCYLTPDYIKREWTRYFSVLCYSEMGLNDHQDLVLLGSEDSTMRRGEIPDVDLSSKLRAVYRDREDLWPHFDERGLGYPDSQWSNLDLYDWALFDGGGEEPSLRDLAFASRYEILETE